MNNMYEDWVFLFKRRFEKRKFTRVGVGGESELLYFIFGWSPWRGDERMEKIGYLTHLNLLLRYFTLTSWRLRVPIIP